MLEMRFEWDERKNSENKRKHGVLFEEAQTVFLDEYAVLVADPDHSGAEERLLLLGVSSMLRHLVVCHCYRQAGGVIRIFSARKANSGERAEYEGRWKR